jgi:AcrR family transcriptional regulator
MTMASGDVVPLSPRAAGGPERGTTNGQGLVAEGFSKAVVDERWRRIVEGASKVIAAKGFAKATIREIAAAADMPVATMYQYLERKEDILYNVYRFFMTEIVTALARWRSSELPPKERLAGAIRTVVEVFDRNHRFIKLMFQESRALTPEARRQVYELDAQYIAIFQELLRESMRNGDFEIRNPELAANFIYFLCTIWPLRHWSIGKFGEESVTREIVEFVLNGLGPDRHGENRSTP